MKLSVMDSISLEPSISQVAYIIVDKSLGMQDGTETHLSGRHWVRRCCLSSWKQRNDNVLKIYRMFKEVFVGCFYSPRPRCCLTLFLHTVKSIQTHIPPTLLPSMIIST